MISRAFLTDNSLPFETENDTRTAVRVTVSMKAKTAEQGAGIGHKSP